MILRALSGTIGNKNLEHSFLPATVSELVSESRLEKSAEGFWGWFVTVEFYLVYYYCCYYYDYYYDDYYHDDHYYDDDYYCYYYHYCYIFIYIYIYIYL